MSQFRFFGLSSAMSNPIGSVLSTAQAGLLQAERQLATSAAGIASGSISPPPRSAGLTGTLPNSLASGATSDIANVVGLINARNSFTANAKVLAVGSSLTRRLLDTLG